MKQENTIKAANRAKYLRISVTDLTGSGVTDEKKPGLGKTKSDFMKTKSVTDISITMLSVVIFSVFTFKLAKDFDWANLIWVFMQVIVFLIKGAMSFMSAYVFVTEEYVNRLIRQTNLLIDFDNADVNAFESKRAADRLKREEYERARIEAAERAELEAEADTLRRELEELEKAKAASAKTADASGQAHDHEELLQAADGWESCGPSDDKGITAEIGEENNEEEKENVIE